MENNTLLTMAALGNSQEALRTCQQITNNGAITGFVVLTQAEYDALPAGKLTDGKVYMVAGA